MRKKVALKGASHQSRTVSDFSCFQTMSGECRVVMAEPEAKHTLNVKSSPSSRLTMALVAFTLLLAAAAAAALLFSINAKNTEPDEGSFDLRHSLRQISNVRAAIHLEGKHNPSINTSVEWSSDVDQSHLQGGLELQNNEILIPRNGLYFVYSQASFRVSCSSRADDAAASKALVHLSHTVQRWSSLYGSENDRSYQTILHSVRTACQKTASGSVAEGNWFSAVYMGAVFNLKRGDRLKTVMEEKMLEKLEDEAGNTFFGVFAL